MLFRSTGTSVTVVVPRGAQDAAVRVQTVHGTTQTATAFNLEPTSESFIPGNARVGDLVPVTGTGLDAVVSASVGGATAVIVAAANGTLTFEVPVDAATDDIYLCTASDVCTMIGPLTIDASAPQVLAFTPTSGLPTDLVTISGLNFVGTVSVTIDGRTADVDAETATDTSLDITVPTGATSGYICVTADGGTGCSTALFTVESPAPVITDVDESGDAGTTALITGEHLAGATSVVWNGLTLTFTVDEDLNLVADIPSDATGSGVFTVTKIGRAHV